MASPNLSFRAGSDLLAKVKSRDPEGLKTPGAIAKRDVNRWYSALEEAIATVRLTPSQAILLVRVVRDAQVIDNDFVAGLIAHIEDDPEGRTTQTGKGLVQRISSYDRITRWALVDAAERYLAYVRKNPGVSVGMALHQVGLHSYQLASWELEILNGTIATSLKLPRES